MQVSRVIFLLNAALLIECVHTLVAGFAVIAMELLRTPALLVVELS